MRSAVYIADTSALIAAWIERYPTELFPEVWEFIAGLNGRFVICEEVLLEITRHAEDTTSQFGQRVEGLRTWLQNSGVDVQLSLLSIDEAVAETVQRAMSRVASSFPHWRAIRVLNPSGQVESADPWVIAYASGLDAVVMSEEIPRRRNQRDVKIPDVCHQLGIAHVNLIEFLTNEGFSESRGPNVTPL